MKDHKNQIGKVGKISLLAALVFSLMRCEVIVDVPMPDFKPSLVLNGFYNTDSVLLVSLTANKYVLDSRFDYPIIQGAAVTLYEEGTLVATLDQINDTGFYGVDFVPQSGKYYKIVVEKSGFETISATSKIPALKANFKIEDMGFKVDEYEFAENILTYSISDELGSDYYETKLYIWRRDYIQTYDEEKDSSYLTYIGSKLSEIGYSLDEPELNEFEDYSSITVFSDELFNGNRKEFKIKFSNYENYDYYTGEFYDTARYVLQVRHVSEEYFKYLVTSDLQYNVDGDPFAEAVQVYNNIENGFGIFAGYNSSTAAFETIHKSD